MSEQPPNLNKITVRKWLSTVIVFVSIVGISITSYVAIKHGADPTTIFNILLPVFTTWVGTVLAFYYGKENFESANVETRQLLKEVKQPDEKQKFKVKDVMRPIWDITVFNIPNGSGEATISVPDLKAFMDQHTLTRLPILTADNKPKYMLHEASLAVEAQQQGKPMMLQDFLNQKRQAGKQFGVNQGFVVVPGSEGLVQAKNIMLKHKCQDIFITKDGKANSQLIGWLSNNRIAQYLEA